MPRIFLFAHNLSLIYIQGQALSLFLNGNKWLLPAIQLPAFEASPKYMQKYSLRKKIRYVELPA